MFRKALKRDAKLQLALCGPAGGGKTYSRLAIATKRKDRRARRVRCARPSPRLGGGIAYVDTEHGWASKYADVFAFDVVEPAEVTHAD